MSILPLELWGLILSFAVDSSIGPHAFSDHLNFPSISFHLQDPRKHSLNSPFLRDLRLVCRTFHSLIPSPYHFMNVTKDHTELIGAFTKALYTGDGLRTGVYLQVLLDEPRKAHRLVMLQFERNSLFPSGNTELFDVLCENAPIMLPNIQSLIFSVDGYRHSDGPIPQFWTRLNEAFPQLHTLSIGGYYLMATETVSLPTFEQVRVLNLHNTSLPWGIKFPALQHASLGSVSTTEIQYTIAQLHSLESLLCQNFYVFRNRKLNWDAVPQLRLLGIPHFHIHKIPSPPSGHPLRHLRIHLNGYTREKRFSLPRSQPNRLEWLARISKRFPHVSRFTLDLTSWRGSEVEWARWGFDRERLTPLGLCINDSFIQLRTIVVDRLPVDSSADSTSRITLTPWKWLTHRSYL